MRILFLCHKMPYPPVDGGAIASLNMITEFAKQKHSVQVLAMQTPKHGFSIQNLPQEFSENIEWHQAKINTNISPIKAIFNLLFSRKPYNAQRFVSNVFKLKLAEILKNKSFDIIQLEGLYLCPYIPVIRKYSKAKISLRAHNIEWLIWDRLAKNDKSALKAFYYGILAKRVKQMEQDALKKVDLLVPITENDKQGLKFKDKNKVFVSPTGIDNNNFKQQKSPDNKTLFHIGALDWIPNQEGLFWFIKNVWIKLKNEHPDWEFVIAGRNALKSFENTLANFPVKYIGEVENAANFIDKHKIMIVPLLAGSGMRIKIIEGMARSKCIVTTEIGAEGINVSEKNIVLASDADKMYSALTNIMNESKKVDKIGEEAYKFIEDNFSNKKLISKLVDFYIKNIE